MKIEDGDTIDFICDYYDYSGNYVSSHMLGDRLTVSGELAISDVYLPGSEAAQAAYVFTDVFGQEYWTPVIPR